MTDPTARQAGTRRAKRYLLVERRSGFSYLFSAPWRLAGWTVLVLDERRGVAPTEGLGVWLRGDYVASRHVTPGFDCRAFHFVLADMVNGILDQAFAQRLQVVLAPLIGDDTESRDRFRTALFKSLRDQLRAFARMVSVADHLREDADVRLLPEPTAEVSLALLCGAGADAKVAARGPVVAVGILSAIVELPTKIVRRLLSARAGDGARRECGTEAGQPAIPTDRVAGFDRTLGDLDARAVMFTHWGPRYGNLFDIDYYYRPEADHPLNPNNLLFIEHTDSSFESFQFLNGAGSGIPANLFRTTARLLRAGLFFPGPRNLLFLQLAFKRVVLVDRFRHALAKLTNARLAIVAYDILCPTELVIAAQNQGIICVAVQERFNSLFSPIHAFVMDRYFVFGAASASTLARRRNVQVRAHHAIGPIRSDWIDPREEGGLPNSLGRRTVLVLDAGSWSGEAGPDTLEVNSWENNALFLDQVICLAEMFPEHDFVIRGKDSAWMDIAYFEPQTARIADLANVDVDRKYNIWRHSYDLVNRADLIVARYTSLGDEALAKGVPVIFHEQTVTGNTYQSLLCDYDGYPVYTYDFDGLRNAVATVLEGGSLMSPEQASAFRARFYNGDASGTVAARLTAAIDDILEPGLG